MRTPIYLLVCCLIDVGQWLSSKTKIPHKAEVKKIGIPGNIRPL
jgi:hypothetical protein